MCFPVPTNWSVLAQTKSVTNYLLYYQQEKLVNNSIPKPTAKARPQSTRSSLQQVIL